MKKSIIGMVAISLAFAASADEVETRQMAMKSIAQTMKSLSAMAKGQIDFDAASAETGLKQIETATLSLPDLFPEGSDAGETEAAPAVWEKRTEFDAALQQFINDATNSSFPEDAFELDDRLAAIGKNCKSCHEQFRIKKD